MNDEEAITYARTRQGWERFNDQHFTRVYVEAYRDGKDGFNGAECVENDAQPLEDSELAYELGVDHEELVQSEASQVAPGGLSVIQ